jgi:hypothetical protein
MVHLFREPLSPVDESACNAKRKSLCQVGRNLFHVGRNELTNYRRWKRLIDRAQRNGPWCPEYVALITFTLTFFARIGSRPSPIKAPPREKVENQECKESLVWCRWGSQA